MAVLKPRNRLVYFRVSEDEFQQFVQLCQKEGARSISDLARDAMHRLVEANGATNGNGAPSPQVKILDKLIGEVSAQLQQLATLQEQGVLLPDGTARRRANLTDIEDSMSRDLE